MHSRKGSVALSKEKGAASSSGAVVKKEAIKRLIYNAILILDVLVIVVAASLAWFAKNTKATGDGIAASVQGLQSYELASKGELGKYSSGSYQSSLALQREQGTPYELPDHTTVYATSVTNNIIEWMIRPGSHFQNEHLDIADEYYTKLQPGVHGSISFYILPPAAAVGTTNVDVELRLLPYEQGEGTPPYVPMPESDPAAQLLKGHILFFENYADGQYSGWISDGIFSVPVEGNIPKEVTLYWIWPLYFGNLSGDSSPICSDPEDQAELLLDMNENPYEYFAFAGGVHEEPFSVEQGVNTQYHSGNYNRADERIGLNIPYVVAEIALR